VLQMTRRWRYRVCRLHIGVAVHRRLGICQVLQLDLATFPALVDDVRLDLATLIVDIPHRGDGDHDFERECDVLDDVFDMSLRCIACGTSEGDELVNDCDAHSSCEGIIE
jgi:hypothetical protein